MKPKAVSFAAAIGCFVGSCLTVPYLVQAESNLIVRVMAANLTSGNNQRYETPGLSILKGLQPDIVALQEFNVSNSFGINTAAALSNMVATTFGANFGYFRESGYAIPNGIISRYPILTNGSWVDSDTGVNDRGFAWAKIDVPGTNDLYIVSVHLKASSGSTNPARRATQAAELKALISTNFPANAWCIVAGDMNIYNESEAAASTFASFLSDTPVPADQNGDPDTNAGRNERYDRVLLSFSMTNLLVPVVMPSRTYPNGLVFDSRIYTSLTDVPPVVFGDSGAPSMQHMGVVRDFKVLLATTNPPALPPSLSNLMLTDSQFPFSSDRQRRLELRGSSFRAPRYCKLGVPADERRPVYVRGIKPLPTPPTFLPRGSCPLAQSSARLITTPLLKRVRKCWSRVTIFASRRISPVTASIVME